MTDHYSTARMKTGFRDPKGKFHDGPIRIFTLNERATKFRKKAHLPAFNERLGSKEIKRQIMIDLDKVDDDNQDAEAPKSTRILKRDRTTAEMEQMSETTKIFCPNKRRKSKRVEKASQDAQYANNTFQPAGNDHPHHLPPNGSFPPYVYRGGPIPEIPPHGVPQGLQQPIPQHPNIPHQQFQTWAELYSGNGAPLTRPAQPNQPTVYHQPRLRSLAPAIHPQTPGTQTHMPDPLVYPNHGYYDMSTYDSRMMQPGGRKRGREEEPSQDDEPLVTQQPKRRRIRKEYEASQNPEMDRSRQSRPAGGPRMTHGARAVRRVTSQNNESGRRNNSPKSHSQPIHPHNLPQATYATNETLQFTPVQPWSRPQDPIMTPDPTNGIQLGRNVPDPNTPTPTRRMDPPRSNPPPWVDNTQSYGDHISEQYPRQNSRGLHQVQEGQGKNKAGPEDLPDDDDGSFEDSDIDDSADKNDDDVEDDDDKNLQEGIRQSIEDLAPKKVGDSSGSQDAVGDDHVNKMKQLMEEAANATPPTPAPGPSIDLSDPRLYDYSLPPTNPPQPQPRNGSGQVGGRRNLMGGQVTPGTTLATTIQDPASNGQASNNPLQQRVGTNGQHAPSTYGNHPPTNRNGYSGMPWTEAYVLHLHEQVRKGREAQLELDRLRGAVKYLEEARNRTESNNVAPSQPAADLEPSQERNEVVRANGQDANENNPASDPTMANNYRSSAREDQVRVAQQSSLQQPQLVRGQHNTGIDFTPPENRADNVQSLSGSHIADPARHYKNIENDVPEIPNLHQELVSSPQPNPSAPAHQLGSQDQGRFQVRAANEQYSASQNQKSWYTNAPLVNPQAHQDFSNNNGFQMDPYQILNAAPFGLVSDQENRGPHPSGDGYDSGSLQPNFNNYMPAPPHSSAPQVSQGYVIQSGQQHLNNEDQHQHEPQDAYNIGRTYQSPENLPASHTSPQLPTMHQDPSNLTGGRTFEPFDFDVDYLDGYREAVDRFLATDALDPNTVFQTPFGPVADENGVNAGNANNFVPEVDGTNVSPPPQMSAQISPPSQSPPLIICPAAPQPPSVAPSAQVPPAVVNNNNESNDWSTFSMDEYVTHLNRRQPAAAAATTAPPPPATPATIRTTATATTEPTTTPTTARATTTPATTAPPTLPQNLGPAAEEIFTEANLDNIFQDLFEDPDWLQNSGADLAKAFSGENEGGDGNGGT